METTSSCHPKKYDVFISFSGEDVRYNFLSHLFKALTLNQVNAFKDENLSRGEDISPSLLNVIKESYISIVIFSKNYPYSTWCLDELAQILWCYKTMNQIVLPVFYHVDPFEVQNLKGAFEAAFVKLRQQFVDCLEKVENWSGAVQEISRLSGFVSSTIRPESELIEEIVSCAFSKLSDLYSSNYDTGGLFGIDLHVHAVESLLRIRLMNRTRIVGIWGMGGIGKTTTADKVYNKIKRNFAACFFAANVREKLEKCKINDLRDEIFRELLSEKIFGIGTPHSLEAPVKRSLKNTKVLIVFDDVDDSMQLGMLLGDRSLYCPGSRIIVTSRDSQVLKSVGAYIYQVAGLNETESLKLFSWRAFHQTHPREKYVELSKVAIQYAQGLPLALIVLGSNLYGRSIEEWKYELERLKSIPDLGIQKILRISYDVLDRNEKNVFLDIACFFKGYSDGKWVKNMLESFGYYAGSGITRLLDKSLVTTHGVSSITYTMHDLLEQMGRDIVIKESNNMPEEQSRLWLSKDVIHVLENNMGTGKIEGISVKMWEVYEKVDISSKTFVGMYNLRYLNISAAPFGGFGVRKAPFDAKEAKIFLPSGLYYLPGKLRFLCWDFFPFCYLPSNFCPHNLVELHMPHSRLKELSNLDKSLKSLKKIDLRFSGNLIRISDLSKADNIEGLYIEGCSSLEEVSWSNKARHGNDNLILKSCISLRRLYGIPYNIKELNMDRCPIEHLPPSIWSLRSLRIVYLRQCKMLASLPEAICNSNYHEGGSNCETEQLTQNIGFAENLKRLYLSGCSKLENLPDAICHLRSLDTLDVSGTAIKQLPENIGFAKNLKRLYLRRCSKLEILPDSICHLKSLYMLDVSDTAVEELPHNIGFADNLVLFRLSGCSIKELPPSICSLQSLEEVNLSGCKMSASVLYVIFHLKSLKYLDVSNSTIEELPENIGSVDSLIELNLSGCTNLVVLPESICNLKSLQKLDVSHCVKLSHLPSNFGNLWNLSYLWASKSGIQALPDSINQMAQLQGMYCSGCVGLQLPPLNGLHRLYSIDISYCQMPEFPNSLCTLTSLAQINLGGNHLKKIPSSFSVLTELLRLNLQDCRKLEHLPSLPSSLSYLDATNCTSLQFMHPETLPSSVSYLALENCINLDQGVSSTIIDIVLDNHLSSSKFKGMGLLCIPGSEIPEKMMYRNNNGSSLPITLDNLEPITGFSLCVVIAFNPHLDSTLHLKSIKCSSILTHVSGRVSKGHNIKCKYQLEQSRSEHMVLWYEDNWPSTDVVSKALFEFYAVYVNDEGEKEKDKASIIKCGLRPIFSGDKRKQHYNERGRGHQYRSNFQLLAEWDYIM